ncbi:MAG: lysylphosphatidylglycerol synthase transmembrane domain-containing protein [Chloroflexota bacterium]
MTQETTPLTMRPTADAPGEPAADVDPLQKRFFNVRTLLSFALGIAVMVLVIRRVDVDPRAIMDQLSQANVAYLLIALALYHSTFIIRALRWRKLLENVGYHADGGVDLPGVMGIAKIVLLSWFANCIVPAKLGDAYRAYMLKHEAGVSFSKTFGTILAERIIDTLLLFVLLGGSVLLAFHGALPPVILSIMQVGLGLVALVIVGLVAMRGLGGPIRKLVPGRFQRHYGLFEEGTLGSFQAMPLVLLYSAAGWAIEAARLYFVGLSLGLTGLSIPVILFVALAAALLTTLPVTPAGLGFVESAIVAILMLAASFGLAPGVDENVAASVAILDRVISYWSIIVIGLIVYVVARRR